MASGNSGFRRSDVQFFHAPATSAAIIRLASAKRLVIYCGAGVSIDRTGLGWDQLISSVFAPDTSTHHQYPSEADIEILRKAEHPLQLASILTRYSLDRDVTQDALEQHVTPLLQNRMYKSNAWQAGLLSRNIAGLALLTATVGSHVDVVTTNYDTLLESSFTNEIARYMVKGAPSIAGVRVLCHNENAGQPVLLPGSESFRLRDVELHYLHGRVPPAGPSSGRLVLSEVDYAQTRAATVDTLRSLFAPDAAVLILGASLTDPPLIEALALTRQPSPGTSDNESRSPEAATRFVVMPRASLGYLDQPAEVSNRLVRHLSRRCELLGVTLLAPDFRMQTAQFCEEIQYSSAYPDGPEARLSDERRTRYGLRLLDWWDDWRQSRAATDPYVAFDELQCGLNDVLNHISASALRTYGTNVALESFRLELWVRDDPALQRRLTLWASSAGPLVNRRVLRHADLEVDSPVATVRAFLEGRPQHLDPPTIREGEAQITRWRSYLSVPIYVRRHGLRTSVGAVTLASSQSLANSIIPFAKSEQTEGLKQILIEVGRGFLSLDDKLVSSAIDAPAASTAPPSP